MSEEYLSSLLYLERRAHAETRRKLAKAEHDRERYAKRIRFIQASRDVLAREFRALRAENQILTTSINSLERVLMHESGTETRSEESAERTAQAETPAVSADDQGTANGRAGKERHHDKRP